ncbi:TonB-dependent siderophore receptor [Alteromonas naphthalenivorans]|uniref:TonB-dependent siderophore receptor n=1 Tax=Alteromonas naphthalenivorans TaxID=715451 RepID=F5Z897_ALTNA|nr:TonB-dependent siderophore receptor [Alteromonas naphthalenivorans]AEF03290.1 TonB-dependent siderophore receptor [Alteromonas naphthalenivorans]
MKNNWVKSTLAISIAAFFNAPAFAQTNDGQTNAQGASQKNEEAKVEKITVHGMHRAYQGAFEYKEVPAAAQDIDLGLIGDAGAINLNDALDLSASVARQNNFGGLWNSFAIRGFSGDENLPSGFLVNGFNAGRGFGGPRDLAGIDHVEVLKGPKAALFGRGEPGGAVNLVTKRPQFVSGGEVKATYGSWDQMRIEADVQTVAGAKEDVGVRLVGFYEDAESFRDTVETEKLGFYPSVTWEFSEDTRITYELEYTNQKIPFDRGVIAVDGKLGIQPIETFVGDPSGDRITTDVVGHQLEISHELNDDWNLLIGAGLRDTTFEGNALETNFAGRQTLFIDPDQTLLSRFKRYRDFETDYVVLRGEIAGEFDTGSISHRVIIGGDYDKFENDQVILRYRPSYFSGDTDINDLDLSQYLVVDILNPDYSPVADVELSDNLNRLETQEAWGMYIQDQVNITDKFQVRFGGRIDKFEQEIQNRLSDPVAITSQDDTQFSPQLGAVYLLDDSISFYATYGEGFRQLTGSDYAGNPFEPNQSESTEVGVKTDLTSFFNNVRGDITLSIFNIDQSNILVFDSSDEASDGFFLTPGGEARSRGVELDVNAEFSNGISLWVSYAYIDAESTNDAADANFVASIEAGDPLINVPENQLSVQVGKSLTVSDMPVRLGTGLLYVDERLGQTATDFYLPSYTTVRAFAQIEPVENLVVRAEVDNLFDKEHYTNSFADVWVEPGAPRRFRVSASYRF